MQGWKKYAISFLVGGMLANLSTLCVFAEEISVISDVVQDEIARTLKAGELDVSVDTSMGEISDYLVEDTHYLFLPNTASDVQLQISYEGLVQSVSTGTLNQAEQTIVVDWDGNETALTVTLENGQTKNIVAMVSQIPCMYIQLNDTTLEEIHEDKDVKHKGNTVFISDLSNAENNLSATDVEMKGRGNSSWREFDKKGYQIKFAEKTAVLGMDPAKKWCLIANPNDGSMMRNKLSYELAANGVFAYTVECEYIDLWVAGEYLGLYTVTEKVENGSTRLDLQDEKGVLVELDNAFYHTEDVYFTSSVTGMHYVQKEVVNEDTTDGIACFQQSMESLERLLQSETASWSSIAALIDEQSFAEYYLVNEIVLNKECLVTSFYFYKDGEADEIHAGPVWDFDSCMASLGESAEECYLANYGKIFTNQTDIFRQLCKFQEFVTLVEDCYRNKYQSLFATMDEQVDELYAYIKDSADMNYIRWDSLGTEDAKGGYIYPTYEENVTVLKNWLQERFEVWILLDFYSTVTPQKGSEGKRTIVLLDKGNTLQSARAAVWSVENGQDDLVWYHLVHADSKWSIPVNVSNHNSQGEFLVHFYGTGSSGKSELIGSNWLVYDPSDTPVEKTGYELVFDAVYYSNKYADLKQAFGNDEVALLNHFKKNGMKEARQGCEWFNVKVYRSNYPDLEEAFGNDWPLYYEHYMKHGHGEGRNGVTALGQEPEMPEEPTPEVPEEPTPEVPEEPTPEVPEEPTPEVPEEPTPEVPEEPTPEVQRTPAIYEGVDYQLVFQAKYYLNRYEDLRNAFGTNEEQALRHFVVHGMEEGRQGSEEFSVAIYRENYPDLQNAFGNRLKLYYEHYMEYGYKEHRNAATLLSEAEDEEIVEDTEKDDTEDDDTQKVPEETEPETPKEEIEEKPQQPVTGLTVYEGVDYALVFDMTYYLNNHADVKNAYGNDAEAVLRHFVVNGMKEGRQAKASFNVHAYRNRYEDLRQAFGSDLKRYYMHYIQNGYAENRIGN